MAPPASRRTFAHRTWALLTSRQLAVVLLLAALAILLLSLVLPQMPRDLDAAGQLAWWEAARERYGPRLDTYQHLGLVTLTTSPTFLAIVLALLLSTLACTVERLGRLWREARRAPALCLPEKAYTAVDWQAEGLAPDQARRALRRFGARLQETAGPPHYFYSANWRLAPLGTVLTHLGLFLLATAALLHGQLAWRQARLVGPLPGDPTMLLEVEEVYDPGAGPFVAGGLLFALGSALSLLFPARQLWARLGEDGRLQVRFGMEEGAGAEERARLDWRLGRIRGGGP